MNGHDWSSSFKQDVETMLVRLTLSLSWCQLKPTNKSTKSEISWIVFFSELVCEGFLPKRTAMEVNFLQDRRMYCLQTCLSTFQPGNLTVWGSEGVKWSLKVEAERRNDRRGEYTVCRRVCKWAHFSARKFDRLGQWMVIQSRSGTTKWHQLSVSALQTEGQTDQVAWGVIDGNARVDRRS